MDGLSYAVTKSSPELRRTLGVLYSPDRLDAHGEFVSAQDLEDATVEFVKAGDLSLRLQHNDHGDVEAGRIVGILPWPYESKIEVSTLGDTKKAGPRTLTMPPGTVYVLAEWTPQAWPLVKSGTLGGYSLGGRARRRPVVEKDAPTEHMGDQRRPLPMTHAAELMARAAAGLTKSEWQQVDELADFLSEHPEVRGFTNYLLENELVDEVAASDEAFSTAVKAYGRRQGERHPSGRFKPRAGALQNPPEHAVLEPRDGTTLPSQRQDVPRPAQKTVSDAIRAAFRR